jgi:carbon-monoxide dehydrogenase small subunit
MQHSVLLHLKINGEAAEAAVAPYKTLLEVLREDLDLTGTKHGCELGECGACTVLVDGEPQLSCLVLALECEGRDVQTIEGLARGPELHPLQAAFTDFGGSQCGYCTPGVIMSAVNLLNENPKPTEREIREGIAGNFCRCTGYQHIVNAIQHAANKS